MWLGILVPLLPALRLNASPRILVAVNSALEHREYRDLARSSWLAQLNPAAADLGLPPPAHVFALSRDAPDEPDSVRLDAPEGYEALAAKSQALLRWFAARDEDLLIAVDDDVVVDAPALLGQVAASWRTDGLVYAGYLNQMPTKLNADPASKWHVPDSARGFIPSGLYVTGQLKVFSHSAAVAAVKAVPTVQLHPWGTGPKAAWIAVEDEYVGALMAAANVTARSILRAAAPQCCQAGDPVLMLDGDTFFAKTWDNAKSWDAAAPVADSLCRYRRAVERLSAKQGLCLSLDELAIQRCPPGQAAGDYAAADANLRGICA